MRQTSAILLTVVSLLGPPVLGACGDATAGEDGDRTELPGADSGTPTPNPGFTGSDAGSMGVDAGTPTATVNPALLQQHHDRPLGVGAQPIPFLWPSEVGGDVEITAIPRGTLSANGGPVSVGTRLDPADLRAAVYENDEREPSTAGTLGFSYRSTGGESVSVSVSVDLFLHGCDELGTAVLDLDGYGPGVYLVDEKGAGQPNVLDPEVTLPACQDAHAAYPHVSRFTFQLARCHWRVANYAVSLELAREAMEAGYRAATSFVAFHYLEATGVPEDFAQAYQLFSMAAADGDIGGLHDMARMLQDGKGVAANPAAALAPLTQAAEWGFHWSQLRLGKAYRDGFGTTQDYVAARDWFERCAAQNNAHAYHNLGVLYRTGRGVAVDGVLAEMYLLRGAEEDLEWSYYNLGLLYRDGSVGVAADRDKAIDYLTRAAAAGLQEAQTALDALR